MSTPTTPTSPKVIAAQTWAFLASLLLMALLALIGYLMTDDGRALFAALPIWVQIPLFAFISALGARLGGYAKPDPLRDLGQLAIEDGQEELSGERVEELLQQARDDRDLNGDGRDDRTGRFV